MSFNRRALLRGALACACCLKAGGVAAETSGHPPGDGKTAAHWGYEGAGAPGSWGDLEANFKVCKLGLEQTPIDLTNGIKGDTGAVSFDYKPMPLRIVNNGHTIQVNAASGCSCGIGGIRYELLQFHFHHPSEHLLAGKAFDLECHFVHKASDGAIAVVGVFIRPGAANAALKAVFDKMPKAAGPELSTGDYIDPGALLPKAGGYFRYMGSLTTPPCSEGLTWTVYREPLEASVEQIRQFAALFANNARPVQKRNRRFLIDAS